MGTSHCQDISVESCVWGDICSATSSIRFSRGLTFYLLCIDL